MRQALMLLDITDAILLGEAICEVVRDEPTCVTCRMRSKLARRGGPFFAPSARTSRCPVRGSERGVWLSARTVQQIRCRACDVGTLERKKSTFERYRRGDRHILLIPSVLGMLFSTLMLTQPRGGRHTRSTSPTARGHDYRRRSLRTHRAELCHRSL